MLPTCYKLDLICSRAFNNPIAAKPLTANRGQEKIHSPWKDFFWMHRVLTCHQLHSLCSRDFIMTFTSQHQEMPPIHPAPPPWHNFPFIVNITIAVHVPSNLHDSSIHISGHVTQHFCCSLISLPLIFIEKYLSQLTLIPFILAV